MQQRKLEIFSAGCILCQEAIQRIRTSLDESWRVHVYDMETGDAIVKAREYGVTRVPSAVVDGRLAPYCRAEELGEAVLNDLVGRRTDR